MSEKEIIDIKKILEFKFAQNKINFDYQYYSKEK